jgi:hypothetical protein
MRKKLRDCQRLSRHRGGRTYNSQRSRVALQVQVARLAVEAERVESAWQHQQCLTVNWTGCGVLTPLLLLQATRMSTGLGLVGFVPKAEKPHISIPARI